MCKVLPIFADKEFMNTVKVKENRHMQSYVHKLLV